MSTVTLFDNKSPVAVPDFLKGAVDPITNALAGGSGGGGGVPTISIRGGVFREIVNGEELRVNEERSMEFIIVNSAPKVHRTFYLKKFSENAEENGGPACWSSNGEVPDADVPAATRQGTSCNTCPQNVKGSGQGDSRACRFSQRIAVMLPGEGENTVYRMTLSATSIFGDGEGDKLPLQAYARRLRNFNMPAPAVVTEMKFDINSATPKLFFKAVRAIDQVDYEKVKDAMDSEGARKAIKLDVYIPKQKEEPFETPKAAVAESAPKKEAEPKAPKRSGFSKPAADKAAQKEEAAAPQQDLEKLAKEWDD